MCPSFFCVPGWMHRLGRESTVSERIRPNPAHTGLNAQ